MDHKLSFVPKGPWAVGRIVDVARTAGGIEFASSTIKNVTVLMLIDAVGPGFERAEVGDLVAYFKCSHIWLRNGLHAAVVANEDVVAVVQGVDWELVEIEGDKRNDIAPSQPQIFLPRDLAAEMFPGR